MRCNTCFDILNRLDVDHKCVGQTAGRDAVRKLPTRAKNQYVTRTLWQNLVRLFIKHACSSFYTQSQSWHIMWSTLEHKKSQHVYCYWQMAAVAYPHTLRQMYWRPHALMMQRLHKGSLPSNPWTTKCVTHSFLLREIVQESFMPKKAYKLHEIVPI